MPTNTPPPTRVSLVQALNDHLDRADRGQGLAYPQADGETKFACDMEDSPYGCPWCDAVEWPDGNPLDVA
ncbi:hypothetical protein FF36_05653 [Frankia torreyi]|uniref:Uncharacterized protein n=1 Tax=Frankia torreyi TaxID=1856 RepID=A0A0D8B9I9_9ACTN|nr:MULTISPECIES: hypothetical protein [Frankia]KJE20047.1 hypothetical protein FF36_05653 [Frankia torreyi]KQM02358.1 hypothetical protein FF86_107020 [Frankia sp. CpI1-P]